LALAVARTHLRRLIRSRASPSGASGPPVVDPLPPSHPTITAHHGALAYLLGSTRYAPPRQPPNASKTAPIASDATECCTWSARTPCRPPRPLRSRSFECWKPAAVNAPLDRSCSARFRTAYVAGV